MENLEDCFQLAGKIICAMSSRLMENVRKKVNSNSRRPRDFKVAQMYTMLPFPGVFLGARAEMVFMCLEFKTASRTFSAKEIE